MRRDENEVDGDQGVPGDVMGCFRDEEAQRNGGLNLNTVDRRRRGVRTKEDAERTPYELSNMNWGECCVVVPGWMSPMPDEGRLGGR